MNSPLDKQTDDALINHARFYSLMFRGCKGTIARLTHDLHERQSKDVRLGYPKGRDLESMETWSIRQAIYIEQLRRDYWGLRLHSAIALIKQRCLDVHVPTNILLQEYDND